MILDLLGQRAPQGMVISRLSLSVLKLLADRKTFHSKDHSFSKPKALGMKKLKNAPPDFNSYLRPSGKFVEEIRASIERLTKT